MIEINSNAAQAFDGFWEKPFAARFIDGRLARIHHYRAQPLLARGDCRRHPCRSSTHNHHVRPQGHVGLPFHQRKRTNSAQNPGPIAASMLSVPGAGRLCW